MKNEIKLHGSHATFSTVYVSTTLWVDGKEVQLDYNVDASDWTDWDEYDSIYNDSPNTPNLSLIHI